MIIKYNKLVRDKIPEIIKKDGKECKVKILNNEDYIKKLNNKLNEEIKEYLVGNSIEELADIEEVIRAILDYNNVNYDEFEKIRNNKVNKRGAFKNRTFLIEVKENDNK